MRVLITGATGYIGYHVLKQLAGTSFQPSIIVRPSSDITKVLRLIDHHNIIVGSSRESIYQAVMQFKPQLLIHIAGKFITEHSSDNIEDLLDSNIKMSAIILDAAIKAGCKNIINTSSCWQNYKGCDYYPVNLYAATKEAFEDIIKYYVFCKQCKALTLQIFDTYGSEDPRNKILNLLHQMMDGETIHMSPGLQKLYYCHIDDVVDAYLTAIKHVEGYEAGTYKKFAVRDNHPVTLQEFVSNYLSIAKKDINIIWGGREYREKEIMDPEGTGIILEGWYPKIGHMEGLTKYVEQRNSSSGK